MANYAGVRLAGNGREIEQKYGRNRTRLGVGGQWSVVSGQKPQDFFEKLRYFSQTNQNGKEIEQNFGRNTTAIIY
ncbi:MAG: hypothetical protein K5867_09240 [Bacteroidales bacterium]|nr:hypothetical protein [Bacteroidales bacterium]